MNFEVRTIPAFEKEAAKLSRKYPSLRNDLASLTENLETNPQQGTSLGNNFYKIRMSISSKGKGKSGGARVISFVVMIRQRVFLAAIYDKSEKENISEKELKALAEIISSQKI